jgi:hypothetical protein
VSTTCIRFTDPELAAIRSVVNALQNIGWASIRDGGVSFTRDGLWYMQEIIWTLPLTISGEPIRRWSIVRKLFGETGQL